MVSDKVIVCKINQNKTDNQSPIILKFQNGKLNSKNSEKRELICAYDSEVQKNIAILAVNENIYHGSIDTNYQLDTYIAIKNKRKKNVHFIQADQALLLHEIYTREVITTIKPKKLDEKLTLKKLLKNFGGRKAGRYLERVERMKVNVNSVKEQLEKTVEEFNSDNENEEIHGITSTGIESIVPPLNISATNINDVYTLNEIISQNLLDRLNEEANEVLTTTEDLPIPSEYISNEILNIKNSPTKKSPENLMKIKVFLYMDGLSALIKTKNRDLRKTNLSHITEKIENHIRSNFSPKNSTKPVKTAFSTDKAMCFFITLAILMSPNYEIDINILTQELSKPRKRILQYCNCVQAKLKPRTDILTLHLPQPLNTWSGKRKRL